MNINGQRRRVPSSSDTPLLWVLPVGAVGRQPVQTIESLDPGPVGRALQQAWLAHQVAQCGYCQSGALMAAALSNRCRCGTHPRMAAAVRAASQALRQSA